jgi:hypothetical protein
MSKTRLSRRGNSRRWSWRNFMAARSARVTAPRRGTTPATAVPARDCRLFGHITYGLSSGVVQLTLLLLRDLWMLLHHRPLLLSRSGAATRQNESRRRSNSTALAASATRTLALRAHRPQIDCGKDSSDQRHQQEGGVSLALLMIFELARASTTGTRAAGRCSWIGQERPPHPCRTPPATSTAEYPCITSMRGAGSRSWWPTPRC